MASLLSSRALRSSFLSLPPHLRTQTYGITRTFSASSSRKLDIVDLAVAGPTAVLDAIHNLGIPWHTALPLTAVLVRTTLVYYISLRPARRDRQIQNQLVPLAAAHVVVEQNSPDERKWRAKMFKDIPAPGVRVFASKMVRWWKYQKTMARLGKEYGVRKFRPWGFLNFGILIAFTEAIRLKCGTREGLLRLLLSPFENVLNPERAAAAQAAQIDAAESLAERLVAAREKMLAMMSGRTQGSETIETAQSLPQQHVETISVGTQQETIASQQLAPLSTEPTNLYFDPTLQTEGLAWATDLTVLDSTFILPIGLLLTMMTNSMLRPIPPGAIPFSLDFRVQMSRTIYYRRWSLTFAWLFFFASVKIPAAILLYFIPSLAIGWVQQRWMDWRYPIQPAILPCKRPIRMKIRKDW